MNGLSRAGPEPVVDRTDRIGISRAGIWEREKSRRAGERAFANLKNLTDLILVQNFNLKTTAKKLYIQVQ